jgi:hypothetical protein
VPGVKFLDYDLHSVNKTIEVSEAGSTVINSENSNS